MDENHDRFGDSTAQRDRVIAGGPDANVEWTDGAKPEFLHENPPIELRHKVTEYPNHPDRCTIYPPGLSGVARMSTWISVDQHVAVDLERMR